MCIRDRETGGGKIKRGADRHYQLMKTPEIIALPVDVYKRQGQCYKKYKARIKDGYSPEELLTAAMNYAEQCRRQKTEQQYIKHGKTFLGDSVPFADFLPKMNEQPVETKRPETGGNPFRR